MLLVKCSLLPPSSKMMASLHSKGPRQLLLLNKLMYNSNRCHSSSKCRSLKVTCKINWWATWWACTTSTRTLILKTISTLHSKLWATLTRARHRHRRRHRPSSSNLSNNSLSCRCSSRHHKSRRLASSQTCSHNNKLLSNRPPRLPLVPSSSLSSSRHNSQHKAVDGQADSSSSLRRTRIPNTSLRNRLTRSSPRPTCLPLSIWTSRTPNPPRSLKAAETTLVHSRQQVDLKGRRKETIMMALSILRHSAVLKNSLSNSQATSQAASTWTKVSKPKS